MNISINGVQITARDGNITIRNGIVNVDGQKIDCSNDKEIIINGNCNNIDCSGTLTVNGNVEGDVDITGNMRCNTILGNIDSTGNIKMEKR